MPLMLIQNIANAWMQQVWVRPTRDFKTMTAGVRRTEEVPIILHPYALHFINSVAAGHWTNGNIEHMNLFWQASIAEQFKKNDPDNREPDNHFKNSNAAMKGSRTPSKENTRACIQKDNWE